MTSKQFKLLRTKMFPTRVEAAREMGVSFSSIGKWEGGFQEVPAYITNLLRCMRKVQINNSRSANPPDFPSPGFEKA